MNMKEDICEHENIGLRGTKTRPHALEGGDGFIDIYCEWERYCKDCKISVGFSWPAEVIRDFTRSTTKENEPQNVIGDTTS